MRRKYIKKNENIQYANDIAVTGTNAIKGKANGKR